METLLLLDVVRLAVSFIFLLYASWHDFKKREVSNRVWIIYGPVGLVLTLYSVYLLNDIYWLFLLGLSAVLTLILSIGFFYLGLFGGADAKLLICLSLAMPWYPPTLNAFIRPLTGFNQLLFPLTVFSNGALIAAFSTFYVLSRNLAWKLKNKRSLFEALENTSGWRKFLTIMSGYRVKISVLEKSIHLYPLEVVKVEDGKLTKRLRILVKSEEEKEAVVKDLKKYVEEGAIPDEVWATPGLPLILFITIGFALSFFLGDPIYYIIFKFLLS